MQLKEKNFKRENESRVKKVVLRTRKINTADLTSAATITQRFLVCPMPYKEGRSDDWQIFLVLRVLRACWNNSPSSVTTLWADVATSFVKEFRIVLIVKVREKHQLIREKILGNGWDQGFKYVCGVHTGHSWEQFV